MITTIDKEHRIALEKACAETGLEVIFYTDEENDLMLKAHITSDGKEFESSYLGMCLGVQFMKNRQNELDKIYGV